MAQVAIIGGTGVYASSDWEQPDQIIEKTKFGQVTISLGKYKGREMAFIPRHGHAHSIPPHKINFRANIMALKQIGVTSIFATAAVGSLALELVPGEFLLPDQFLNFTHQRESTFFTGGPEGVAHCDMTIPYCPSLRGIIKKTALEMQIPVHNGGTYVCTEGPRFETAAEIKMFKKLGGDIVGMTSVPEVCLARELGICYASIALVTNYAAGIAPGILTHSEVVEMMENRIKDVRQLLLESICNLTDSRDCHCRDFPEESTMKPC